jgi:hypothetical protein
MNNRTRYSRGGAPPGQGREGANRGWQRLLFEDEDYDFVDDIYYQCRDMGGHDYKVHRRAVFQVNDNEDPRLPPYEGGAGGLDGGGINLPPLPNVNFGVGPQGQHKGLRTEQPSPLRPRDYPVPPRHRY